MAEGDIGSVQASLEFEAGYGGEPFIFHIAGHVYAVLYYQVPLHGILKTFTISDDGLTLALTGASIEYDDTRGIKGKLTHIAGNVYAICYQGPDDDGWIKTVTISDDGLTLALTGASLEFDLVQGAKPRMIHIAGNVYAVVYWGPLNDGWLKTVTISDDGLTLALTGSSLEFDPVDGWTPDIHHRDGTVYAIIYQGDDTNGMLCTVNIADDGTITDPIIASLNWTPPVGEDGITPKGIHIGGSVYAVVCQNAIKTLSVSADGLTLAIIDEGSGPVVTGMPAGFIPVSGDVYVYCFEQPGSVGELITKEIPSDGVIPIPNISFLNFATPGEEPQIIYVTGNIYAIVCRGTGSKGYLHTVDIETVIAPTSVGGINPALEELMV